MPLTRPKSAVSLVGSRDMTSPPDSDLRYLGTLRTRAGWNGSPINVAKRGVARITPFFAGLEPGRHSQKAHAPLFFRHSHFQLSKLNSRVKQTGLLAQHSIARGSYAKWLRSPGV